jgi:hypothetical protein
MHRLGGNRIVAVIFTDIEGSTSLTQLCPRHPARSGSGAGAHRPARGRGPRPRRASVNLSYFDDPAFNRRLAAANALPAPARYDAYRRLDQDLARAAPAIALENNVRRSFLSARIGCAFDHPVYGIDLTALCLRKG